MTKKYNKKTIDSNLLDYSPTEGQIKLVANICHTFNISDFPSCSKEFTRRCYAQFISEHYIKYRTQRLKVL